MSQEACTASERSRGSCSAGTVPQSLGEAPEGNPQSRKLKAEGWGVRGGGEASLDRRHRVSFHLEKVHWEKQTQRIDLWTWREGRGG